MNINTKEENIMANATYTPKPTEVCITGIGSYLNLWEPKAFGTNDPKYSMVILFKKTDKRQVEAVRKAIEAAEEAAIDKVWKGKRPGKINSPVHDGDELDDNGQRVKGPEYEGMYYMNVSNRDKPGIVDQNVQPILERDKIYSGCIVNCFMNFFGYSQNGNNGISASLENVQLVSDGKRLSGKQPASAVFAPVTDEDLAEIDDYLQSEDLPDYFK